MPSITSGNTEHYGDSRKLAARPRLKRAYREHLGYSIDDMVVTSGLSVEELEMIETGPL